MKEVKIYYVTSRKIKKYYPNASEDELKDIQEVAYLLACAVMQEFYGPPSGELASGRSRGPRPSGGSKWMGGFEDSKQEEKL